ncbi:Neuronal growth regulator 1 [Fukomys damarensis]|uniref:Neuronal growth regulator 1 n=1 Tax=Fukomys damarensis TaxID=885580 RepID=A0A091CYC5_FUKDA|nr:Neuronal growth regulator 1 [Fukomys damarensis]
MALPSGCTQGSGQRPELALLFNGQQGIIIQNFSTRSILTVTNVTQEHFGNYTCVAANKLGTTNASLPLNLRFPNKVLSKILPPLPKSTSSDKRTTAVFPSQTQMQPPSPNQAHTALCKQASFSLLLPCT